MHQALSSSTGTGNVAVTGGSNQLQQRKRRILRSRSPQPSAQLQGKDSTTHSVQENMAPTMAKFLA
ncbi:hypothetical protein IHE44_0007433 [Lamprotornis superbus]|uniref:Uncharacterized protein n=1 Tax=Lamprotornis superbus TaxID=245042 RepID=A0A835NZI1_9PASS|nr:hypothetical protein IHE44_0007433 [Lamprotornis superbus]